MHILTEAQYQAEAEPVFRQIFATYDPSADDSIFTLNIASRRILHPCYGSVEPLSLMDAIIAAAANLGDTGCYILVDSLLQNRPRHGYISLSEFSADKSSPETQLGLLLASDYFIYSECGKWGLALSGANYGLLGGSPPPGPQRIEVKLNMDIISENIIYSDTGRWGIMLSHECNGLLGGTPEFIEEVQAAIPDLDLQVYGFLKRLQGFKSDRPLSVTLDWLPGLLSHVYGSEIAEKLLQETGLP